MAEKVLQRLEEQLNCSICLDTYTDPKLLQCFHVYCRQCLVPLVDRDQQGQLGLTCPTCRQVTTIPDREVAGLQSAFHINRFLEIKDSLEKPENPATTLEVAAPTDVNPEKRPRHCSVHEGKELELYCETCGELICWKCIAKSSKHHDHDCEELDQAFMTYSQEITSFLEPMEKQSTTVKKVLAVLDARCGEISDQRAATADNIHVTFRRLREVLSVRETELISQLDQLTLRKLKDLAAQRDQIETILAQLNSCLHFMRESLRTGNGARDVLLMKANTVGKVKELTTPFQPDILEPNTEADIVFTTSVDTIAVCQKYGQVFAAGLPDPSQCHVMGKVAEVAAVGEKCTATLQAVDFEGEVYKKFIKSLEYNFVSEITHTRASCSVERNGQSQYKISYQPTIKGRHQLHIKVESQHIRGSPFSVAVKSPVEKLGTPILTIGGVVEPWGVTVNHRGEAVVAEWGGHCISVFSPSGEKLRSFGTHGSGSGQIWYPREVAVDGEGNILVADSQNHRIQRFTSEGQFLTSVGTEGSEHLQFSLPTGIAFSASNNKVHVTDYNHRVQDLNSDLTFSSTFGKRGSGKGQFGYPYGIASDSTGKVYVADRYNHRIQVFSAGGRFLRMFGRRGQGRGELNEPIGVTVDTSDMVYVSEKCNHRISVFTSKGQFVTSFGRQGEGPGEFVSPYGLAVGSNGVVYVCDHGNNCVLLF